LAEIFKVNGINISTHKPQINRDLSKPFFSAIFLFDEGFEEAKEKMKYIEIDGCPVRSLPFDNFWRGDNKANIQEHYVFYKFPKDP
jgi:hypothetical protein